MAEFSGDSFESGEAEDKGLPLKPHAQAHLLSATDYCKICGERAARHVHYGAITCFSCRAFFRRSLQNNTSAKYICRRRSDCDINCKTRRNCQYCRYMKCLSIGMNPNYVLTEEEKKKRFHKGEKGGKKGKRSPDPRDDSMDATSTGSPGHGFHSELRSNDEAKQEMRDESKCIAPQRQLDQKILFCSAPRPAATLNTSAPTPVIASPPSVSPRSSIIVRNNNSVHEQEIKKEVQELLRSPQEVAMLLMKQEPAPWSPVINPQSPDNFSSMKTDLAPSLPSESNIWCSNEMSQNMFGSQTEASESNGNSLAESLQSVLQSDKITELLDGNLFYNAFDDIETTEDEGNSPDSFSGFEDQRMEDTGAPKMISEADTAEINHVVETHDKCYFSVNFGEVLIKDMLMSSMFGVQISTSSALQAYKLQVERITRIANSLPCFTNLTSADQVTLLKENADLIVSLRGAIFFDKKKKGMDQILSSIGIKDRELVDGIFSSVMGTQDMNHIEYKIFNSIQDPATEETENHYRSLQAKVADAIRDHCMSVMMTYIILFSPDSVQLENKKLIEKIQYNYLKLLEVYIHGNHPRAEARQCLANALGVLGNVREMANIKKARSINQSACSQSAQYKV